MISYKKNFLFIHIPKTAGDSIISTLSKYALIPEMGNVQNNSKRGNISFNLINILKRDESIKHQSVVYFQNYLKEYQNYFTFTVIRNPFNRIMSYYFFTKKRYIKGIYPLQIDPKSKEFRKSSFVNFVKNHDKTQLSFLKNIDGKVNMSYILRFENLKEDFEKLLKLINVPPINLNCINSNNVNDYSKYYDDELIELVKKTFKEDFEYFSYFPFLN